MCIRDRHHSIIPIPTGRKRLHRHEAAKRKQGMICEVVDVLVMFGPTLHYNVQYSLWCNRCNVTGNYCDYNKTAWNRQSFHFITCSFLLCILLYTEKRYLFSFNSGKPLTMAFQWRLKRCKFRVSRWCRLVWWGGKVNILFNNIFVKNYPISTELDNFWQKCC